MDKAILHKWLKAGYVEARKLLIMPSAKNVKALLEKVRGIIRGNKAAKQENLVGLLNPVLRGWANYHRGIVASQTFARVDSEVWQALWRWARRRHTRKGRGWIAKRYFHSIRGENWVFGAWVPQSNGKTRLIRLFKTGKVRIVRHVMVQWEKNPFLVEHRSYFDDRRRHRMQRRLEDRKHLSQVWQAQNGACPSCGEVFDEASKWHVHHRQPRSEGGTHQIQNLALLHPNCHMKIHYPQ